ncbi:CoA-binding protein [Chenggangzhangella methanolivorans]|uniref:CoA-binding protein n=1 Tax=Chenggangzhangella methanolivorans TaxID=1437009 RepID=A0A9E6R7Y5_9HYPH|nr:CoA-binding protein [Chenggangzhangella methanolivorans]QZN99875.1 CoA-binding protein [Chenggangzhangella methanolivorans]
MPVADADIRDLLEGVRTIAVVGASPKADRPSYDVAQFLARSGYHVFPVNPAHGGGEIAGLPAYASLADIPEPIDMVDVFRASEHVAAVLDEALALPTPPKVFWTQLGVVDAEAAVRAEAAGLAVVMDRCPKIELLGDH